MALFKISRREFLERTAAGLMTAGAGGRAALAADITLGIVYVGPRESARGGLNKRRRDRRLAVGERSAAHRRSFVRLSHADAA